MTKNKIIAVEPLNDLIEYLFDQVRASAMDPPDAMRVLNLHTKWLQLYETTFENDGKQRHWLYASRKRPVLGGTLVPSAVITVPVLVEPDGSRKLVVIKEFRIPLQTYEYHFPAGLLEPNEDVLTSAKRELKEEAGLELTLACKISGTMPSSSGMTDETAVMVYANCVRGDGKQNLEQTEDIEVMFLDMEGVRDLLVDTTKMVAAKTWPTLILYDQLARAGKPHFVLE